MSNYNSIIIKKVTIRLTFAIILDNFWENTMKDMGKCIGRMEIYIEGIGRIAKGTA